jgi:hypothetical protein
MKPVLSKGVVGFDGRGDCAAQEIDKPINVLIVAAFSFKLLQRGKRVHPQVSSFF